MFCTKMVNAFCKNVETFSERALYEKRGYMHWLCALPSLFFKGGVKIRHFLYDHALLKSVRSATPVVSVGNIAVGGVGKTPVTLLLAQQLIPYRRIAILSRAYRANAEHYKKPLVVSKGKGPCCSPAVCGDEAWLLASRLPQAIVLSGKNRVLAAQMARDYGAQLILLDDGMQYRRLHRDVEIVVLDGENPFSGHRFLPWGRLREDPRRLSRANLIILSGQKVKNIEGNVPAVQGKMQVQKILTLEGREIESLHHHRVAIFCGIAAPQRFLKTVEQLGARVVARHFLPDHRKMEEKALGNFAKEAEKKGATLLLCTEKDKVKFSKHPKITLPIAWVKSEFVIMDHQSSWEKVIENIKKLTGVAL